jgi:hypothetical protein
MAPQTIEGTWEEIVEQAAPQLAGRRVRVTVLEETSNRGPVVPPGTSLAEAMKDYVGKYASGEPHNHSEQVEEIFGEGVAEKIRKTQERKS